MAKPDIVFVPGLWEGPQVFDACAKDLRLEGYEVHLVSLLSTGSRSREESQSLNLYDDVAHVRFVLEKLIHREREIVLVLHSAGGFIGSHAIEGLSATARQKQGLKGGVVRLAFLAAVLLPEGDTPPMMQFFSILVSKESTRSPIRLILTMLQGDKILCKSPRQLLFNDLKSDEDAAKYLESLQHQPGQYWEVAVTYGGWKDVPSSYLFCKVSERLIQIIMLSQSTNLQPKERRFDYARCAAKVLSTCRE